MKKISPESVFNVLAKILETNTDEFDSSLNELNTIIDDELVPSIEKIQYSFKYDTINKLKETSSDLSLYLKFPELINKTVVAFHNMSFITANTLYNKHFDVRFRRFLVSGPLLDTLLYYVSFNRGKYIFPKNVPVIISGSDEFDGVRCLNNSGSLITLDDKEYISLLKYSQDYSVDISRLLCGVSFYSDKINKDCVYIIMPPEVNKADKYHNSFLNSADVVVLPWLGSPKDIFDIYKNIKTVFFSVLFSILNKDNAITRNISQDNYILPTDLFNKLGDEKYNKPLKNVFFVQYLENLLYEVYLYLAKKQAEYEQPIKRINEDLIYKKDDLSGKEIKKIQLYYNDKLYVNEQLYRLYKNAADKIIALTDSIQKSIGFSESMDCINEHLNMPFIILELILKMSDTFKVFRYEGCREKLRDYIELFSDISGNTKAASFIKNNFDKNSPADEKAAFAKISFNSDYLLHKKNSLKDVLQLSYEQCYENIGKIKDIPTNDEKYILGMYYYTKDEREKAKKYLYEAFLEGNAEARKGIKSLELQPEEMHHAADYLLHPDSAFTLGMELSNGITQSAEKDECYKFLHIAAAYEYSEAVIKLGDMAAEYEKDYNMALSYYKTALKSAPNDRNLNEKLAYFYYQTKQYVDAIECLKKAPSAENNYYLGVIYENGYSVSVDYEEAANYYKLSANAGNPKASKAYKEVQKKIRDKAQKDEASSRNTYGGSEFSDVTTTKGCYITTATCEEFGKPDDCYELTQFRKFRDVWLKQQPDGERLIQEYYATAPSIVAQIDKQPDRSNIYRVIRDNYLSKCLRYIENDENEKCKDLYVSMMNYLYKEQKNWR